MINSAANSYDETPLLEATPPLVEVKGLRKEFPIRKGFFNQKVGSVQAVSDVSFNIYKGETLGLVGESGCGKSTLGRCLLQLLQPTAGEVWMEGRELGSLSNAELRAQRRDMQIIFQNPYSSLNPRMRVDDIIAEPFIIHRLAKGPELTEKVHKLLDTVGLPREAASRYPHEFSGGQRQRIGIARALALQPKLIVADEPVSALDVSIQAQILNLLNDLKSEFGLTLLFIAHNLSVVEHISDRVMVMYLGKIAEIGSAESLYHEAKHPYTQALLQAIPVADPKLARARRKQRHLLEGDPPNPAAPPSGCRFHTRCPQADERCSSEIPEEQIFGVNQRVYCHYAGELPRPN